MMVVVYGILELVRNIATWDRGWRGFPPLRVRSCPPPLPWDLRDGVPGVPWICWSADLFV